MKEQPGYISVSVTTGDGSVPVSGAEVVVSALIGGSYQTLYRFLTDESGLTPVFALSVSAPDDPATAEFPDARYSNYRIVAAGEGYYTLTSPITPVFSGIVSYQPMVLKPLTASCAVGVDEFVPTCCHCYGTDIETSGKGVYGV